MAVLPHPVFFHGPYGLRASLLHARINLTKNGRNVPQLRSEFTNRKRVTVFRNAICKCYRKMSTCYRLAVSDSLFCRQCVQVCVAVFAASEFPAITCRERTKRRASRNARKIKHGCVAVVETRDVPVSLALLASQHQKTKASEPLARAKLYAKIPQPQRVGYVLFRPFWRSKGSPKGKIRQKLLLFHFLYKVTNFAETSRGKQEGVISLSLKEPCHKQFILPRMTLFYQALRCASCT